MSDINTLAAFPTPGRIELRDVPGKGGTKYEHKIPSKEGMDLRDYFAAKAMQGHMSDPGCTLTTEEMAAAAYRVADAMMDAREVGR